MGLLRDILSSFSKKKYGTPSRTLRGELVKSKAEKQIADYFTEHGIRYIYEYPAKTNALVFKETFAKPISTYQTTRSTSSTGDWPTPARITGRT